MFETRRLRLRGWRPDDLPSLDPILGDPDVMAFSDRGPLPPKDRAAWLATACGAVPAPDQPLNLAIEDLKGAEVVGYIGLSQDPQRVAPDEAEVGFRLAKSAWGQGIATEAATCIVEVARQIAALRRVVAIVDPYNRPSLRVLAKIGMRYEKDIVFDGYDHPDHLFARDLRLSVPAGFANRAG